MGRVGVMMSANGYHIPVMASEVCSWLELIPEGIYVDATFGGGGYSEALLKTAPGCQVLAIDQDPDVLPLAQKLKEKYPDRFDFIQGNFSQLDTLIPYHQHGHIQGIVFDLGVSSHQVDHGSRGFSFQKEGPLDMRMSQQGQTVGDLIETASEGHIADILYHYGQEFRARKIARRIVENRNKSSITSTLELRRIIHSAVGKKVGKIDSATKSFQAFRIYVNDECFALKSALEQVLGLLAPKGRVVIVSFHSLEDGIVKTFFKESDSKKGQGFLEVLTKRVITPSEEEIQNNPRARSARLRAASRTLVPFSSVHKEGDQ